MMDSIISWSGASSFLSISPNSYKIKHIQLSVNSINGTTYVARWQRTAKPMFSRANSHNLLQNTSVREWLMSIVNQHISELELLLSSLFPIYTRKLLLFLQTRFLLTSLASTSNTSQSARLFHEGYLELNHSPHLSNLCLKGVIMQTRLPHLLPTQLPRKWICKIIPSMHMAQQLSVMVL